MVVATRHGAPVPVARPVPGAVAALRRTGRAQRPPVPRQRRRRPAGRAAGPASPRPCRSYRRTSPGPSRQASRSCATSAGDCSPPASSPATRRACCYRPSATSPATWNNGPPTWTPRRSSPRPAPTAPRCCSPASHLTRLSPARAALVERQPGPWPATSSANANLREQAGRIEALPLLGVLDEQRSASDDFAAMMAGRRRRGWRRQCRRARAWRELASLLQRYPGELRRTRDPDRASPATVRRHRRQTGRGAPGPWPPWNRRCAANASACKARYADPGWDDRPDPSPRHRQPAKTPARVPGQLVPALGLGRRRLRAPYPLRTRTEDLRNLEDSLNRLRSSPSWSARSTAAPNRSPAAARPRPRSAAACTPGSSARPAIPGRSATPRRHGSGDPAGRRRRQPDRRRQSQRRPGSGARPAGDRREPGRPARAGRRQGNAQSIERLAEESATIGSVLT